MRERVQTFGGEHTRRKLDVVAKYLTANVTIMKKQDFRLFYVDGFADSGASTSKAEMERADEPTLFAAADFLEGSPIRALSVEPPFDEYLFVDEKEENIRSLAWLAEQFPHRKIQTVHGDANQRLREFCERITGVPRTSCALHRVRALPRRRRRARAFREHWPPDGTADGNRDRHRRAAGHAERVDPKESNRRPAETVRAVAHLVG